MGGWREGGKKVADSWQISSCQACSVELLAYVFILCASEDSGTPCISAQDAPPSFSLGLILVGF